MTSAVLRLFDADLRADFVTRGTQQAAQFTFAKMAREYSAALIEYPAG